MNFGVQESFYEKHRYFFQNYDFNFEGLSSKSVEGFTKIIERLSGSVSRDADYILTETPYFETNKNRQRTNLYNINYILDSMNTKVPLDINKYRFTEQMLSTHKSLDAEINTMKIQENTRDEGSNSKVARKSITIDILDQDSISCKTFENRFSEKERGDKGSNTITVTRKSKTDVLDEDSFCQQIRGNHFVEKNMLLSKRLSTVDKENKSCRKNEESSRADSDCEIIDISDEDSNYNRTNEHQASKIKSTVRIFKRKQEIVWEDSSSSSDTTENSNKKGTTKNFKKTKLRLTATSSTMDLQNMENDASNKDLEQGVSKPWWLKLPPLLQNYEDEKFEELESYGQPEERKRGPTFKFWEQRLMLAYLIVKNKIHLGLSRLPWREMRAEGYLRHRTVEAINNNFRRVLLKKIGSFGLPKEILLKFRGLN